MKKALFLLMTSLFAASMASAQDPANITVTNRFINYKYRTEPSDPQKPLFFDYGVRISKDPSIKAMFNPHRVIDKVDISGQNKVRNVSDEGFVVRLVMTDFTIVKTELISSGDYYMEVKYSYKGRVRFTKGDIVLYDGYADSFLDETWRSAKRRTAAELTSYWNNNRGRLMDEIFQQATTGAIEEANRDLSTRFGFYIRKSAAFKNLKWMNTKKHSENAVLRTKVDSLGAKLDRLDGTKPLTEADLTDELTYLKSLPTRFATASKADAKFRFIAYFDLCETYLALDMPDQVTVYADLLIANGQNPKTGERFKKDAEEMKELFSKSFFKTRQFDTSSQHKKSDDQWLPLGD